MKLQKTLINPYKPFSPTYRQVWLNRAEQVWQVSHGSAFKITWSSHWPALFLQPHNTECCSAVAIRCGKWGPEREQICSMNRPQRSVVIAPGPLDLTVSTRGHYWIWQQSAGCISFIDFVDSHICFGGVFSLSQVKLPIIYLNTICDIFHILVSLFCKTFDKIKCFDLSNLFN